MTNPSDLLRRYFEAYNAHDAKLSKSKPRGAEDRS